DRPRVRGGGPAGPRGQRLLPLPALLRGGRPGDGAVRGGGAPRAVEARRGGRGPIGRPRAVAGSGGPARGVGRATSPPSNASSRCRLRCGTARSATRRSAAAVVGGRCLDRCGGTQWSGWRGAPAVGVAAAPDPACVQARGSQAAHPARAGSRPTRIKPRSPAPAPARRDREPKPGGERVVYRVEVLVTTPLRTAPTDSPESAGHERKKRGARPGRKGAPRSDGPARRRYVVFFSCSTWSSMMSALQRSSPSRCFTKYSARSQNQ